MNTKFEDTFKIIKEKHDEAYKIIERAIRYEEEENQPEALNFYTKGIENIDEALAIPVGVPDDIEAVREKWNEACQIIHKLKRTRAEILLRICSLSEEVRKPCPNSGNLENGTCPNSIGRPRTYSELAQALREMQGENVATDVLELIFSCEGAKLYRIRGNGTVCTASDDSILRIVRLEGDQSRNIDATIFIQLIKTASAVRIINVEVGEDAAAALSDGNQSATPSIRTEHPNNTFESVNWIYPLVPGVSPCFRTEYGAFIFPDLESGEQGASVGITVPTENGADDLLFEILEAILHGIVTQKAEDIRILSRARRSSEAISQNIVRGASFISSSIVSGASKAGVFISSSTPYLISKIRGVAPHEAQPISGTYKTTVAVAKGVTGAAAGITGYISGKVSSATMALGRYLAPHIQKHGSTLLSKGFGISEHEAQEQMSGVLTIAAGAVEGFGTVYAGLEDSAIILGKSLSGSSVEVIKHAYGEPAGNLAAGTFDTVGNVINITQNAKLFTPKGLMKNTAKNTGKALVGEFRPGTSSNVNVISAASMYPDLSQLDLQPQLKQ